MWFLDVRTRRILLDAVEPSQRDALHRRLGLLSTGTPVQCRDAAAWLLELVDDHRVARDLATHPASDVRDLAERWLRPHALGRVSRRTRKGWRLGEPPTLLDDDAVEELLAELERSFPNDLVLQRLHGVPLGVDALPALLTTLHRPHQHLYRGECDRHRRVAWALAGQIVEVAALETLLEVDPRLAQDALELIAAMPQALTSALLDLPWSSDELLLDAHVLVGQEATLQRALDEVGTVAVAMRWEERLLQVRGGFSHPWYQALRRLPQTTWAALGELDELPGEASLGVVLAGAMAGHGGADTNNGAVASSITFDGIIDEVKIFGCAVDATQAATDYADGWPF